MKKIPNKFHQGVLAIVTFDDFYMQDTKASKRWPSVFKFPSMSFQNKTGTCLEFN